MAIGKYLFKQEVDEDGNPIVAAPAAPAIGAAQPSVESVLTGAGIPIGAAKPTPAFTPATTAAIGAAQPSVESVLTGAGIPIGAAKPTIAESFLSKAEGTAIASVARPATAPDSLFDTNEPDRHQLSGTSEVAATTPATNAIAPATRRQPTSWDELKAMRATPVMTGRLVDSMEKQYPGWANLTPTERNATLRNQIDLERSAGVRKPLPPAPNVSMGKGFGIGGAFEYGQGEKPMEIGSDKYNRALFDIVQRDKSLAHIGPSADKNAKLSPEDRKLVEAAYTKARGQLKDNAYLLDPETGDLTMPGGGTGKVGKSIGLETDPEDPDQKKRDEELTASEQKTRDKIAQQEKEAGIERGPNGELWSDAMAKKQLEDVPFAFTNPSKESMGIYKGQDRVAKGELSPWFQEALDKGGALNSSSRPSGDVQYEMDKLRADNLTARTRAGRRGYPKPPYLTEAQRQEIAQGQKSAANVQTQELKTTLDTLEEQGRLSAEQRNRIMQSIQNNPSLADMFLAMSASQPTARPK